MGSEYYEEHKFEGLKLENETIADKNFVECSFIDCVFDSCKLINCSFSGCMFEKCSVMNPKAEYTKMSFSEFIGCNLVGVYWQDMVPSGKYAGAIGRLQDCHLKYNTFSEMRFNKFDFSGTEISRSMFAKCELVESSFKNCGLQDTEFFQCDMRKADFRNALGYKIDIMTNKLKAAKFSYPDAFSLLDSLGLKIE